MKVLVIGATGGTGRATIEQLLREGHEVTAFSRGSLDVPNVRVVQGDVRDVDSVRDAVRGQDAVIVALGISENPLRVRLRGPASTSMDVRSVGTRHVIEAMRAEGVSRLVVQTTYGLGETRRRMRWVDRLFFALLLKPQIQDTERQGALLRESGLDWIDVQPVHLTDADDDTAPFASTAGEVQRWQVSRASVARFLAKAVEGGGGTHTTVALSGAA